MAPQSYPEIRKFSGLYLQSNSFDVPDGAMEICQNVEIQSDAILTKSKGWYRYFTPDSGNTLQGITEYDDHLIAFGDFDIGHSSCVLYFTDNSSLDPFSPIGVPTYLSMGLIIPLPIVSFNYTTRTAEQNENLYFTTLSGIYKLESFDSQVIPAGVPPGLDLRATVNNGPSGPLPPDSQTGYRILFGRRDIHNNLLLSSPSDIATIGLFPDQTGATYTSAGAGPYTVTVTTTEPHGLSVGQQIIITSGTSAAVNGTQTITATPTAFTYQFVVIANPAAGSLDFTYSREATLEFSIPAQILDRPDDSWFFQVYRTTSSAGVTVSPSPDFKLIAEVVIPLTDLDNRFFTFTDDVDPILAGAELYTNPNTREGELQANARPPQAEDIQLYKEYMLYANSRSKQRLFLSLVNPFELKINTLRFDLDAQFEEYVGMASTTDVVNQTVTGIAAGVTVITITYPLHGASTGWTVEIIDADGTLSTGTYTVGATTPNTFQITTFLGQTATIVSFSFVTNGVRAIYYVDDVSASLAVQIANTAYYLVKAINRTSDLMYANYASSFDDAPGKIRIELQDFVNDPAINLVVTGNFTSDLNPFIPPVFNSGIGNEVRAISDNFIDGIYVSKRGEPEAVPVINFLRVGARQKAILRIFALRDSVIVMKEDGIFRMTGDSVEQFQVTILDGTVQATSAMGADLINNNVLSISSDGAVSISESAVQIISRRIDDVIQPIISGATLACAFGYDNGRTWYLSINQEILGRLPVTYLYNILNQSWTTIDLIFRNMALGPSDNIYGIIKDQNYLARQRKTLNLVDYCSEFMTGTAQDFGTYTFLTVVAGNIFIPAEGDIVVFNDVISRILTVTPSGPGYNLTFLVQTNILVLVPVNVVVYQAFTSTIKFSPFHAGQVGREKLFSQLQIHLRQNAITNLDISFANESFGGSEMVDWSVLRVTQGSQGGWGFAPWGFFAWGQEQSISILAGTYPASIIRTLVPLFAARSTWIQGILEHRQAGEPLLVQALSWVVRGYAERTTR